MTRVTMTMCNRCGHTTHERRFEGMNVQLYDFDDSGSDEDAFTLCDPCVADLRKWIAPTPVPTPVFELSEGESR